MNRVGQKIAEIRTLKGWSQESLAEKAKVNLRTIQRIENGENNPSGNTLNSISAALDTSPDKILNYGKKEDKTVLKVMHLSVLTYLLMPIGNIIVPLIIWLTKKDKTINLDEKGIKILNFQLLWTFITTLVIVALFLSKENPIIFKVFLYIFILLNILNIVLTVIITSRTSKPKFSSFPTIVRLIK